MADIKAKSPEGSNTKKEDKKSMKEQLSSLKNLPPFFKMIWQAHKGLTVAMMLLRLLKAIVPIATLYVGKEIIDEVVQLSAGTHTDVWVLWKWVAVELGIVAINEFLNRGIGYVDGVLGDLFSIQSSVDLMEHSAKMDLAQFEDATFYDKLQRARTQTTGRVVLMSQVFSQLQDLISIVSLAGGLIVFNAWLLLLLVIAVIPTFLNESYFNRASYSLTRSWTAERRQLDYLRYIGASDETAKEVKLFGISGYIIQRFKTLSVQYFNENRKLANQRLLWGGLISLLGTLAYYVAYVWILKDAVIGVITLGTLTFLAGSFNSLRNMVQGMFFRLGIIADQSMYLQDLFDFLAMEPTILQLPNGKKVAHRLTKGITFENVGFKYPNSEKWAVRHLSFHIGANEKIALVGENGAGKTTIVKLITRLYDPNEGDIYIDSIHIKEYDTASLHKAVGVIFQDFQKYNMTIRENMAVGDIEQISNDSLLEHAAEKSLADGVVEQYSQRFDQMLGKRFDKGVELSGGQWQKVALARAYMKEAALLILDEPTAALDAKAEYEVFLRFTELVKGKAAILISHRFSTVRMADRILYLEDGKIVESGSHETLLALDGKYAALFLLQAKGYQ